MFPSLHCLQRRPERKEEHWRGWGVKSCADRLALGTDLEVAPGRNSTVPETLPGHGVPSGTKRTGTQNSDSLSSTSAWTEGQIEGWSHLNGVSHTVPCLLCESRTLPTALVGGKARLHQASLQALVCTRWPGAAGVQATAECIPLRSPWL